MRPLIIGENEKRELLRIKYYAESNPFSVDNMLDIYNRSLPPIGENKKHVCVIPIDFRVVFSIETQKKGLARHVSISVPDINRSPSIEACDMIIKELGFKNTVTFIAMKGGIYLEKNVVNIIEYI